MTYPDVTFSTDTTGDFVFKVGNDQLGIQGIETGEPSYGISIISRAGNAWDDAYNLLGTEGAVTGSGESHDKLGDRNSEPVRGFRVGTDASGKILVLFDAGGNDTVPAFTISLDQLRLAGIETGAGSYIAGLLARAAESWGESYYTMAGTEGAVPGTDNGSAEPITPTGIQTGALSAYDLDPGSGYDMG